MSEASAAFVGSVPENYERYLGPMFFEPYGDDLVARLPIKEGMSVLETACGTGLVTQRLRAALPENAQLVATDLNEAMLAFAQTKVGRDAKLEWKVADLMELPFPAEMFDVVVCQFGVMFVPDKERTLAEAHRVLRPGGRFLFNVWDSLAKNDFSRIAHETIVASTAPEPIRFFEPPYGSFDQSAMRGWLEAAGFKEISVTVVPIAGESPSAADAARGLVQGTPVVVALKNRGGTQIEPLTEKVTAALERELGKAPCRGRMQALVWEATR